MRLLSLDEAARNCRSDVFINNMYTQMKKFIVLVSCMALVSCGISNKVVEKENASTEFRLGTYNVWVSKVGKGDYVWDIRKHRLAQSIVDMNMDVFGIQEVDLRIQRELPELLWKHGAAEYEWYVFSPYSQDGIGDKAQALLWRKDKFKLVEAHYFWFSETPDFKSKGWDEKKYYRGGFCAVLKDKKSGRKFFLTHAHFPLAKEARVRAADVCIEMEKKFNRERLPSFLIGDLNNRPDAPASEKLRTYWTDSYLYLPPENKEGSFATQNGADINRNMDTNPRRIDYVYFRDAVPLKYCCFNKMYDGFWPSDHCAVYVDMKME